VALDAQDNLALWGLLEDLAGPDSLLDWIPLLSPSFMRPDHLRPLAELFTRAMHEPVYAWVSVPPRHSKTETIIHGNVHRLLRKPETEIAYVTYEANLAYSKSRRMRDLATAGGLKLRKDAKGVHEWLTHQGGGVRATGVGGPLTGRGADLMIIDDPFKNREEAESVTIRNKVWDWFTSTALTRVEPGGSVIVCHTRWHDDDLIGRIKGEYGNTWLGVDMPAVKEITIAGHPLINNGMPQIVRQPLWPERWPLDELDKKKRLVGPYDWASLYQGQPRPKGGRLFGPASRYEHSVITEAGPYKIVIGADPAATEKTSSDYSVAVVMGFTGTPGTISFRGDVLDVYRGQVQVPEFVNRLRDLAIKWGAPIAVEAVGGFKAVPQMLHALDKRLRIIEAPVMGDKFTRALPASAAWNDGRIRVPLDARAHPWIHDYLAEVEKFTGVKDAKDDQVDATSHAYNAAVTLVATMAGRSPKAVESNLPFG
jgi:predicted phage terminase large subunit-like protein